jgi:hypothetical protein
MSKRQKRRSQPWRAGSGNADANRVAREDHILDGLVVNMLALPPGHVFEIPDGRVAVTAEANEILTAIRNICGPYAGGGEQRVLAAMNRIAHRGHL